ncbi:MAG: hypothetical protein OQK35_03065 [Alphaproteobacteria bacterium]|nr:hypothetical protein [Rhodospirillales bacterium]MCW9045291.1 hypothetical protein [Alphaproteobacteria bacterium]
MSFRKTAKFPLALYLLLFALGIMTPATQSLAQSVNLGGDGSGNPIEVFADNGIEWIKNSEMLVARGNARALKGDMTIDTDELRAYYRNAKKGGTEVWRLDAVGAVKVVSGGATVHGDKGIYDVDSNVFVVTGKKLRLISKESNLTARDSLEYWTVRELAVARGDAVIVQQGKRLQADVLSAQFAKAKSGQSVAKKINAFGNVRVVTQHEVVTADKGVYNVGSNIVTLSGSVKMTRGSNQLNGCSAQVNLKTNVSKLYSCKGAGNSGNRVRGSISREGKTVIK